MKKVKAYLAVCFANTIHEEILEVEDDMSEKEIDNVVKNWADCFIDYGWSAEQTK